MRRSIIAAALLLLALAALGSFVNANGRTETPLPRASAGFICPITGEQLPCPNCCPLNQQ
jgi:hypothetical protein